MENQYEQPSSLFPQKQSLPNANLILVLGIFSIITCVCSGFPGLICGIIAIILGNKAVAMYNATPDAYTEASFGNVKAGRICAIIGISLASIFLILIIFYIIFVGTAVLSTNWYQHFH